MTGEPVTDPGATGGEGFVAKPIETEQPQTDIPAPDITTFKPATTEDLGALFPLSQTDSKSTAPNEIPAENNTNLEEMIQLDRPSPALRYLMIRLSDPYLSQGKVERPVISQQSLDDFKRDWFNKNFDLLKSDGTLYKDQAAERIGKDIDMNELLAKYIFGTENGDSMNESGPIGPQTKESITEKWLGTPANPLQPRGVMTESNSEPELPVNIPKADLEKYFNPPQSSDTPSTGQEPDNK